MKKKITLSILFIMAISLSAAFGAIGQWNTGDQYIPCYLYESVYSYPTTAIAPKVLGADEGQTISFDIPPNICPPSKTIRTWPALIAFASGWTIPAKGNFTGAMPRTSPRPSVCATCEVCYE